MYSESEIDVEDIEFKVGTGSKSISGIFTVYRLFFVFEIETDYSESDVERDVLIDENADSRGEIEPQVGVSGSGGFRFPVVVTAEVGIAGSEREFELVEDAESAVSGESDILSSEDSRGERLVAVSYVGDVEAEVIVEVYLQSAEVGLAIGVDYPHTD